MIEKRGKTAKVIFIIIAILVVIFCFILLWKFNGMDIYSATNVLK
jgi:hypothetical protein